MKYIDEVEIKNKKVIVRCDYNVPIINGEISDNTRIKKSIKTLEYLLNNNCSIIILSHMGRIKTRDDKAKNTLKFVAEELSKLLNRKVIFIDNPVGSNVIKKCKELKEGEIILLENTRYCDYPEKLESNNDMSLANYWASLGDIFVVDAFATLHRAHASVAGIAAYIPTYFGFLVKEELTNLKPLVTDIQRPFSVFMGGAKIEDKIKYIKNILPNCDYLLLGGGIANSFLYAFGYDIGDSLCTNDEITIAEIKKVYNEYKEKIILPTDFVFDDKKIMDLNSKSINKFVATLAKSKTIFINGTCGVFEDSHFALGTIALFKNIKGINAIKIAGGGDTVNCINKYHLNDSFTYISSGGGASLEYVANHSLESLEFINKNEKSTQNING